MTFCFSIILRSAVHNGEAHICLGDGTPQKPIQNQVVITMSPPSNLLTKPIPSPPQHIEWNTDTPHVHT